MVVALAMGCRSDDRSPAARDHASATTPPPTAADAGAAAIASAAPPQPARILDPVDPCKKGRAASVPAVHPRVVARDIELIDDVMPLRWLTADHHVHELAADVSRPRDRGRYRSWTAAAVDATYRYVYVRTDPHARCSHHAGRPHPLAERHRRPRGSGLLHARRVIGRLVGGGRWRNGAHRGAVDGRRIPALCRFAPPVGRPPRAVLVAWR
jgi:hypothetical protein